MNKIKNILLVSYIKNKGIRRLLFVFGALFGLSAFAASRGIERITSFILTIYFFFFVACIIKWIISGFKESNKTK